LLSEIKKYLLKNANPAADGSVSSEQRKKRFEFFMEYCSELKKPLKILDIGGSDYYWKNFDFVDNENYSILILNSEFQQTGGFRNISFVKGDAKNLGHINDNEYDLVFSNSMIEHLCTFEEQKKLGEEIRRIGKKYFIQTPNYYFPLEPHFLFPFFQFLSVDMKTKLISNYNLGWFEKQEDSFKAKELAESIRLLTEKELKEIFKGCKIYKEKFYLLNKSLTAYS
jgi:ubiquinone/menaquinone biosynthesis C-methylase UbiE